MDFNLYNLANQFSSTISAFIDWLAPRQCLVCTGPLQTNLAHTCSECALPYLSNSCERCGQPYSEPVDGAAGFCGSCLAHPREFDACFCAFEYDAPISDLICRVKYGDQPQLARLLAELFVEQAQDYELEMPDAIISVPMHQSKLRARGFNQSTELAKHIAKALEIPLLRDAIRKTKLTERQATQSLVQRKINQKGSFACPKKLNIRHVALIDDVVTTGATAEEIAKILKKNGVDYVQVWGIARTK